MMDEPVSTWTVIVDADTSALRRELDQSARIGRQFGTALGTAFDGIAVKGKSLGDVLRTLALDVSRMAFRAAFRPLEQSFGSGLASLFSGGLGTGGAASLAQGTPVPFAKGGVIASPIAFPLGGGTGIAGESGAEAIMPLARGPDGRLGVAASGSSGVNVTVNVTATDVESFRRSETQIAALLARALGQGQRNL
jgi:phage-related minor tail protein